MCGHSVAGAAIDRAVGDVIVRAIDMRMMDDVVQLAANCFTGGGKPHHCNESGIAESGDPATIHGVKGLALESRSKRT